MKIERVNGDLIIAFINSFYLKNIEVDKKLEFISHIKDLIIKIDSRYKLNLNGFYKIKVYPNKKIGIFLEIIKIDENDFCNGADFRIVIYQNQKFYLEIEDYDSLDSAIRKIYYNEKYYLDIDEIIDLHKYIDMGTIIYGDIAKDMICYGKRIK